jgi:hypothetical protein
MSRVIQTIGLLLLGAAAAGGGAAYFLHQANADRSALIAQAEEARRLATEATQSGKAVADEANRRLDEASQEVAKAQARVHALEEERDWFSKAEILMPPRATNYWKEWLNYTHGFSIRLPTNVTDVKNNAEGLDAGWIDVKPYTNETISLETSYIVGNRLLVGSKNETGWILRVQASGTITHVVFVYPDPHVNEKTILDALSTLTFRDE